MSVRTPVGDVRAGWFGEPWPNPNDRAGACDDDAARIAVPFGAPCLMCGELIEAGDRGIFMPYYDTDGAYRVYEHLECFLRTVMGCSGAFAGGARHHELPIRQDARRLLAMIIARNPEHWEQP